MSRTRITSADVPKYIRDIASRLRRDLTCQNGVWGYNWGLYGQHKIGYENQLATECQKLLAWCRRYYAEAELIEEHYWWHQVPSIHGDGGSKWHRQRAYRAGVRNYVIVTITDPVAQQFEKDNFYRGGKMRENPKSYSVPALRAW